MGLYQFKRSMTVNATLDEVWEFISSPRNLKKITPEYMDFNIRTEDLPDKIYPGMIIRYIVRPLLGIKTPWVTEITQVKEKEYFVDEQRVGPYAIWHHEYFIKLGENGFIMHDIVSYKPPFGFLGNILNHFIINKKLEAIFQYRKMAIRKFLVNQTSV